MKHINQTIIAIMLFSTVVIVVIGLMGTKIIEQKQELQRTKASLEVAIEHISTTVLEGKK